MSNYNQKPSIYDDDNRYLPIQQEMYENAQLVAFADMLHAGYTNQAIRNTTLLAQAAIEPMRQFPEFRPEFHSLVKEYADFARRIIREEWME